jgi:RepB DNA-primase from phage plasmid
MLTAQAIRGQLAAMPHELFLIRLIHGLTKRPFPGERLWTADQLMNLATIRFLRARNREGCDIYIHPYSQDHNAGYILVDLDHAQPTVVAAMCAQGHEPCLVLQTSPGHLQAWVHVSSTPLPPDLATAIGKHLALTYGGDRASTDWRHLGRLAGFTNQKPQRRTRDGCAPWVKVVYTHPGLARHADELLQSAAASVSEFAQSTNLGLCRDRGGSQSGAASAITAAQATAIYQTWMHRWQIAQRFAPPDWSIVDLWVARALLAQGWPPDQVQLIIRLGSPQFPRCHTHPDDYLRRTLARAFLFPFPGGAVCVAHDRTPAAARANRARSNSAGGQ